MSDSSEQNSLERRTGSLPTNDLGTSSESLSPRYVERPQRRKSFRNSISISDIFALDFQPFEKDTSKKYVLSLDGGGMRVQAIITILKEIEIQTHRRVKKKKKKNFFNF